MRPAAGVVYQDHQANGCAPENVQRVKSFFQNQVFKNLNVRIRQ
jgi:hypothetical protein